MTTRIKIWGDRFMNTLRRLSISQRLWLILIVAMTMLLALGLLMLKQLHDDL